MDLVTPKESNVTLAFLIRRKLIFGADWHVWSTL